MRAPTCEPVAYPEKANGGGQKYIYDDDSVNVNVLLTTSTLRLLGRFTTCIAQTTTASRLFFALNGTSCLRNEFFLEIFDLKTFFKFCTITMTY